MTDKRMIKILTRVRKLITPESHWVQHVIARAVTGRPVKATSPKATKFCLMGAIEHVCRDGEGLDVYNELLQYLPPSYPASLPVFNDRSTHAGVIQLIDSTIWGIRVNGRVRR